MSDLGLRHRITSLPSSHLWCHPTLCPDSSIAGLPAAPALHRDELEVATAGKSGDITPFELVSELGPGWLRRDVLNHHNSQCS